MEVLKKLISELDNLDPMPMNQAILLGVAISFMIGMLIFGSFV